MTAKRSWIAAGSVALSFFLTRFLLGYFGLPEHFMIFLPIMALMGTAVWKTVRESDLRLIVFSGLFAVLLSLSWILGDKIDIEKKTMSGVGREDFPPFLLLVLVFFFASSGLVLLLKDRHLRTGGKKPGRAFWPVCSVVLFLMWLPYLLIYYPGNISGDSVACISRAAGEAVLSNQQPVFYILLMCPFLLIGRAVADINAGIAAFLVFQTACQAAAAGYLAFWLRKKGCPLPAVLFALAFFALNPVFGMYAVTLWKDVPFAAALMLYSLDLYEIAESRGKRLKTRKELFRFLILSLLVCFLRNNGYYIVAAVLIVLLVFCRKDWKRCAAAFLPVLILVPVIQGPFYTLCGVQLSPFAESVGIPLQQMGRVVLKDGKMTEEQKQFLNRLLPLDEMKQAYDPLTSNGIKFHKDFDNVFLARNKAWFFKTWAGMMIPNKSEYAKAYLMETLGYWHIGTQNWYIFYGTGEGYGAQEQGVVPRDLLSRDGEDLKKRVETSVKTWEETPLLSDLNNMGFLFWLFLFSALLVLSRKRNSRRLLPLLPLLFLWGTLMVAAPTYCELRYLFAFSVSLPFFMALPFLNFSG